MKINTIKKTTGFHVVSLFVSAGLLFAACSKSSNSANTGTPLPVNAIRSTSLTGGNVKGTMLTDSTYTVSGDITVLPTDTLTIQPGTTIKVSGNHKFTIQGIIASLGTQAKPITITTQDANPQPGEWGGFQCDSAKSVTFLWTKLLWAGGADASGGTTQTIAVSVPIPVDIEDCWFVGGQDNQIGVYSTSTVKILRNSFYGNGTTDGDCIDFHSGVTGVVAYNVLWGSAGSAIKVFTSSTIQNPQTNVEVYNNTCVESGFRRGAAEPGRGVLIDAFSQARVYNNLLANNYWSLDITPTSDFAHTVYNNNYFYVTVDSLRQFMYPAGEKGTVQSGDIINLTTTGANDPKFVGYSTTVNPNNRIIPSNYDFHLQSNSPALGKGYTGTVTGLPSWAPALSSDIGAYVSDTTGGKGNRHAAGY
ncbi:right-handed parallel beta-helix repeat-containing protein [Puia dinghuensis]|uniref:Right handed beta helix domain-containing protein n=1 Tax=Puia dinghuensis TaxID=1792502 RepID=A0A8J2XSR9_9BACT|nr:right-handed parallel beta-helix repeat-containing protein [Puia dinghuensis]GGA98005.1 hypothetical protein GCM10011511_21650 [Puia dinghuensis]